MYEKVTFQCQAMFFKSPKHSLEPRAKLKTQKQLACLDSSKTQYLILFLALPGSTIFFNASESKSKSCKEVLKDRRRGQMITAI